MSDLNNNLCSYLNIAGKRYAYFDLRKIVTDAQLAALPYSIRILLENIARCSPEWLAQVKARAIACGPDCEVPFFPNRLMFHDTTCLPALADFAGMRDMVEEMGGDPRRVDPEIPVVLAIDHSVIVEHYGRADAAQENLDIDYRRNSERYHFIKWAQRSLDNFSVIPPGTGIIHQMNMEALAKVVWEGQTPDGQPLLHPDNMVATDSHTPMINAIGVLGWGVGGLEGQAAMLGEPVPIRYPQVVGVRVTRMLSPYTTATDLALYVTEKLRKHGVVGKFVEFYGPGLDNLSWAARGTVSNMAPEYGATVVFFPFDNETMSYLRLTDRPPELCERITAYLHAQSLWRTATAPEPVFDEKLEIDLSEIEPSVAGPFLPHQLQKLSNAARSFHDNLITNDLLLSKPQEHFTTAAFCEPVTHGAVVISAITSCTNTANPALMVQAGLLARNARARGMMSKPWVKTSLSPGSQVVADYLSEAGLIDDFTALGFAIAGFGCMTCIGNSGKLEAHIEQFADEGLKGVAVLSGNRNFQGRVNPKVPAGYLASPALCVAYALSGTINVDLTSQPLGYDSQQRPVFLHELMPSDDEVATLVSQCVKPAFFSQRLATIWDGTHHWQALSAERSVRFPWSPHSTYLRRPGYLEAIQKHEPAEMAVANARILMVLGDDVTTDHISPAGAIPAKSLAGEWLLEQGENEQDLNQYSTRRSNHEVMLRGAFTNRAVKNLLLGDNQPGEGVRAWNADRTECLPVYQASQSYLAQHVPLVVIAGINYGAGSSRDWAAKAQALLGVRIVIAKSFERIHRSNLIGMGIIPLQFVAHTDADSLNLTGNERLDFYGLDEMRVGSNLITLHLNGHELQLTLRIDSRQEINYLRNGGVLPYVIRKVVDATQPAENCEEA